MYSIRKCKYSYYTFTYVDKGTLNFEPNAYLFARAFTRYVCIVYSAIIIKKIQYSCVNLCVYPPELLMSVRTKKCVPIVE